MHHVPKSDSNFPLCLKSINAMGGKKTFLVKHRIPFDVKNTKSSKVSLPLNIMTPQNPEQETHFQTHPYKALQSQRESSWSLFGPLVFLYFA